MRDRFPHHLEMPDSGLVHLTNDGAFTEIADDDLHGIDGLGPGFTSDFEHLLQQMAEAKIGPDGQPLDDLGQQVMLREMQRGDRKKEAPHVRTGPISWDRGVLGGVAVANPNQNTALDGDLVQIVHWPGDDGESTVVGITVQPLNLEATANSTGIIRPQGRLVWGTRGQHILDFDVGSGVEFSIVGSSAYLSVYLEGGSTAPVQMQASLGFHNVSRLTPLTRTAYLDAMRAGSTTTIRRPNYAQTILTVDRNDPAAPTAPPEIDLTFKTLAGAVIGYRAIVASAFLTTPVVIPNDCQLIDVKNAGGANTNVRVVFGLL